MPINIPMMSSRRAKNVDASELQDRASTFIPPHLLEQAVSDSCCVECPSLGIAVGVVYEALLGTL